MVRFIKEIEDCIKMQKRLIILLILSLPLISVAQTSFLKEAAAKFDRALITKDTVLLKQLLHNDATYGHSNGWVETKREVIKNLISGKLSYQKLTSKDDNWIVSNNVATQRNAADINYILDGKSGELHLHVLKVWLKTNKGWQLLSRQSTKIEKH